MKISFISLLTQLSATFSSAVPVVITGWRLSHVLSDSVHPLLVGFADFPVFSHSGRPNSLYAAALVTANSTQTKVSLLWRSSTRYNSKCATSLTHGFTMLVLSLASHELIWEDIPGVLRYLYQFYPTLCSNPSVQAVTSVEPKMGMKFTPVSQMQPLDNMRLRLK